VPVGGVERRAGRRRVLLVGVRERNHQHHDEVGQGPQAAGEQRQHHEDDAHDGDVDIEIGGDSGADAAQHGALADLIQAAGSRFRGRVRTRSLGAWRLRCAAGAGRIGLYGAHFLDQAVDLLGAYHILVRPQIVRAFVGDRLLEIRHDLGAIRIVLQLLLCGIQVGTQGAAARLFDVEGNAVEIDDDDGVHDQRPNSLIVVLM
jgi:hypothetical protein